MKKIFLFFLVFTLTGFCQLLNKVYILSEGSFSPGTAQLAMITKATSSFVNHIFTPGQIGLYPDGLILYENYLYLTEQGSFGAAGKIYKLDTNGTVINSRSIGTNPYSLAIANNKIYITNGPASNVSVINLNDFTDVKTIPVGVYPQEIIHCGSYIFVANTSLFGGTSDSTISVISPELDSVIAVISVGKDPSSFSIGENGNLLVGVPGDGLMGKIITINPNTLEITKVRNLPQKGFSGSLNSNETSQFLYYIGYSNDIVRYNLTDSSETVVIQSVFPNNYYYGYAYDYSNMEHYVLDAKNFMVSGFLSVYQNNGLMLYGNDVGIAPRRIVFKFYDFPSSIENENIVSGYHLYQNYPNPFNSSTKIKFSIPAGVETFNGMSLRIYDVLGKEVATIVNEEKQPGVYEIDWNAAGYSSGVYFYRLQVGNNQITKSMILIK